MTKTATILLLLAAGMMPLHGEEAVPKISVTGTASRKIPNDAATIQLGIENKAPTKKEAEEKTKASLEKLTAWIRGFQGTLSSSTTSLAIYPIFNDRSSLPHAEKSLPKVIGYNSSVLLNCEIEAGVAGDFAAQATGNGATSLNGPSFHIREETAAKSEGELLTAAFANAKEKALILASAADRKLGGTLRIQATQNYGQNPVMPMARAMMASDDSQASTPYQTESGNSTLNSSVTVDFELLPSTHTEKP